jgi:hypothetical protein
MDYREDLESMLQDPDFKKEYEATAEEFESIKTALSSGR